MFDPYRYLPCGLHEALVAPDWAGENGEGGGPFPVLSNDHTAEEYGIYFVDLAHPAGWDHAVRALLTIKGAPVPESGSVAFDITGSTYAVERFDGTAIVYATTSNTPADRREALCRCICAALGLDVGAVFPGERS